ncbi:MAG: OB-fold nucleic acid binding domain-containing protein, partial [Bacteroidota bacterium]
MYNRTEIASLLKNQPIGEKVTVMGWVRAFRNNQFIALHDGSDAGTLQIVVDPEKIAATITRRIGFHACIMVTGSFQSSQGAGQQFEILADTVEILGDNDLEKYPLQPKRQTMEFLRQKAHFRMRTQTFSAVFRIRHAVAFAVHKFYNDRGFYYL